MICGPVRILLQISPPLSILNLFKTLAIYFYTPYVSNRQCNRGRFLGR
jgi:hypothetical protein